ncbi:MAG: hypothetical protein IPM57_08655 [Oligoflexia bacterium]|nr:hypothetical protein [Oligoflexia bacterium]
MKKLKLIYFKGCPNVEKIRRTLKDGGFDFEEINQNELSSHHPLKNYSSPTILRNEEIIFGSISSSDGGCSLKVPDVEQLRALIMKV